MVSEAPDSGPLPDWPSGTPAILAVSELHVIPVSTAMRAGDRRVLFALARRRQTLRRLRADGRAALAVLAEGVAFTASGEARVLREELEGAPSVAALELRVEHVQDHLAQSRAEILAGVAWRWADERAHEGDARVMAALRELGAG